MSGAGDRFSFNPIAFRKLLIDYLRILSSPPGAQAEWLKAHDLPAQELSLEYYDYESAFDEAERQGVLTPGARKALDGLTAYLDTFPVDFRKGTRMLCDPEWEKVRVLASAALREFG